MMRKTYLIPTFLLLACCCRLSAQSLLDRASCTLSPSEDRSQALRADIAAECDKALYANPVFAEWTARNDTMSRRCTAIVYAGLSGADGEGESGQVVHDERNAARAKKRPGKPASSSSSLRPSSSSRFSRGRRAFRARLPRSGFRRGIPPRADGSNGASSAFPSSPRGFSPTKSSSFRFRSPSGTARRRPPTGVSPLGAPATFSASRAKARSSEPPFLGFTRSSASPPAGGGLPPPPCTRFCRSPAAFSRALGSCPRCIRPGRSTILRYSPPSAARAGSPGSTYAGSPLGTRATG